MELHESFKEAFVAGNRAYLRALDASKLLPDDDPGQVTLATIMEAAKVLADIGMGGIVEAGGEL